MLRSLAALACCLAMTANAPALASPQTDADYIATRFITDDEFAKTLRAMLVKAHAQALSSALSARSVKIKDQDKFVALLPNEFPASLAQRLRETAADQLMQNWQPDQLRSAAEYLRQSPLELRVAQPEATADADNSARPLKDVLQETSTYMKSRVFKDETALSSVAFMLFFLVVQERRRIEIDLQRLGVIAKVVRVCCVDPRHGIGRVVEHNGLSAQPAPLSASQNRHLPEKRDRTGIVATEQCDTRSCVGSVPEGFEQELLSI